MPDKEKKKKYPFEVNTDKWNEQALMLQASFAPRVYVCAKCGAPVITGFSCTYCHDMNPQEK